MKDVSLRLESLKLSSSKERIKLLVTSSATLRPQDERFRQVRSDELIDSMESGKVCITRGPSCELDFGFAFKKLQPDGADQNALVEELGRFVLGAPVSLAWTVNVINFRLTESCYSGGHNFQFPLLPSSPLQAVRM